MYSAKARQCSVIRCWRSRRNDVPCDARENSYTHLRQSCLQGRQPSEGSAARTHRGLPFAPLRGTQKADRQLQITHTSKDTREVANLSNTALAACRITLAGAAETGARSRHASFDPIRVSGAVLGDTDTGGAATRTNPVHFEAVQIRAGGRSKFERRYPDSAGGLMRSQKCGRGMRGNLDCSAPRGNAWVSG